SGSDALGPVLELEPSGTRFLADAIVQMPLWSRPLRLRPHIDVLEADGSRAVISGDAVIAAAFPGLTAGVQFPISGFTEFQPAVSSTCNDDSDCVTGLVCHSGACGCGTGDCTLPCGANSDCGSGLACLSGLCVSAGNACSDDSDCGTGQSCQSGVCA